jgi:SAM-dependent methyltransferase
MAHGRKLFESNQKNWHLPLSKFDKLSAGGYIILKDYSEGAFPPTFEDQARAYEAETRYMEGLPGTSLAEVEEAEMRKPFWGSTLYAKYSRNFLKLLRVFEQLGLQPRSRILELGCGTGWMAEFLALSGYSVVGTSIAPKEIALAKKRTEALRIKGFDGELDFALSPMECVDNVFNSTVQFDGVFVFEALHHAFDWRKAIRASYNCLKPGGWLILAQEPNVVHTFVSYRVSKLANTHEIGMSRKALLRELRLCAFSETRIFQPKINNLLSHHWVAGRR